MTGFFDSSMVSASIAASNATFAALQAPSYLAGDPFAQAGYASIMNGINNAISFGNGSTSSLQVLSASGFLTGNDFFDQSTGSFADIYQLPIANPFGTQQVAVGVATNQFNSALGIIDYNTGQLVALSADTTSTGTVLTEFTALPGHAYFAIVESLQHQAVGQYTIVQVS